MKKSTKIILAVGMVIGVMAHALLALMIWLQSPSKTPSWGDHYMLVYNGPTTCKGCPQSVADIGKAIGMQVKYVSVPAKILPLLADAAVFAIGGTRDAMDPMRKLFTPDIQEALQQYVRGGGRYWGICGGGFFAAQNYPGDHAEAQGLQLIPADAENFGDSAKAQLLDVTWNGKKRLMYFQSGPRFLVAPNTANVKIIATYDDGHVAAMISHFGSGAVAVSGTHPEADAEWLADDHLDASQWQPTKDLAEGMLKDLMAVK